MDLCIQVVVLCYVQVMVSVPWKTCCSTSQGNDDKVLSSWPLSPAPSRTTLPCSPSSNYFGFCVPWTCHLPMNQCLCMCYFLFLECSPHFFLWLNSVSPSSLSVKHHSFREVAQRDNISPTQLQLSLGQDSLVCPPTNPTFVLLNLSCT